jgi:putative flippase GtrA
VYDDGYKANVETVPCEVAEKYPTLHLVGRNGMHKYNQDHAMMTSMLTVKNILANAPLRRMECQRGRRVPRGGQRWHPASLASPSPGAAPDRRTVRAMRVAALYALLAQLSRYWIVSVLAMSVAWTIFLTLMSAEVRPAAAGVLGYLVGSAVHFALSIRFVFDAAATQKRAARLFGEFALSGLAGIAITGGCIAIATQALGLAAVTGKVFAMLASFTLVYSLRRKVVFASPAPAAPAVS